MTGCRVHLCDGAKAHTHTGTELELLKARKASRDAGHRDPALFEAFQRQAEAYHRAAKAKEAKP